MAKRYQALVIFLILLALACGNSSATTKQEEKPAQESEQEAPAEEVAEEPAEAPTPTPEPPTPTPEPTATQGPPPTSVALSGSGDSVADITPAGPMIAKIKGNDEASFFAVTALDSGNQPVDLLVNTTEAYQGTRPLNLDGDKAVKFEIKATGPWSMELLPLAAAEVLATPGEYSGNGDQVLILSGTPGTATITGNEGKGFFAVIGHGSMFPDLLVNTTDTYSGQSIVDGDVTTLVIQASGPWSIKME
jgi:glucose/arabinose dehydrogenase